MIDLLKYLGFKSLKHLSISEKTKITKCHAKNQDVFRVRTDFFKEIKEPR